MTVEVQTRSVVHIGNDIATEFSFVFRLLDEEFLEVYLRNNATEVETLLSDSVYSVVFNDDGGTVTYPLSGTPISDEYSLIIKRTVPYTQETEISNQGGFQPVVLENQLDLIVMQIQQLAEDVARAVKMKTGTDGFQVPSPVADLYLGWSDDATRLVNKAIASLGDVVVSDDDTLSSTDPLTVPQTNAVKQHLIANYQPLDADLTAIAAFSTTGFAVRTASNTWVQRSIAGTSGKITVTNGDGVSGNPTITVGADIAQLTVADQVITGGARVTSLSLGTITSGTVTPDPGDRPMQHYTNNGAHTLAPGSNTGSYLLDITNAASAGAITTSGWTKKVGDAFTTTNGHKFRCSCSVGDAGSLLVVQAMQ